MIESKFVEQIGKDLQPVTMYRDANGVLWETKEEAVFFVLNSVAEEALTTFWKTRYRDETHAAGKRPINIPVLIEAASHLLVTLQHIAASVAIGQMPVNPTAVSGKETTTMSKLTLQTAADDNEVTEFTLDGTSIGSFDFGALDASEVPGKLAEILGKVPGLEVEVISESEDEGTGDGE